MKFAFIAIMVLFSHELFAQNLSGTWQVAKRTCGDGTETMDRFIIGEDQETWSFDPVKSEFFYQLKYINGELEVRGTYTQYSSNDDYYELTLKNVWASPAMWEDEWKSNMKTFGINIVHISESEIQIDAQLPPFQNSCWSTVPLLGNFKRN